MLPEPHRLHRASDFSSAVRQGRRMGRRDLVVHAIMRDVAGLVVISGGPRFGLVVNKAVGSAVIRHRVARRLRHVCAGIAPCVSAETDVVIRALPSSATASSSELERQLVSILKKLGLFEPGGSVS